MPTHTCIKVALIIFGLSCSLSQAHASNKNNSNKNKRDTPAQNRVPTIQSLAVDQDAQIGNNLEVSGDGVFNKKLSVHKKLHVHGESDFDGKIHAEGGLKVEHSSCFDGTV